MPRTVHCDVTTSFSDATFAVVLHGLSSSEAHPSNVFLYAVQLTIQRMRQSLTSEQKQQITESVREELLKRFGDLPRHLRTRIFEEDNLVDGLSFDHAITSDSKKNLALSFHI